ncbi:MAG: DUF2804 domain-containing protein [Treponema sp.]|nr:DUF2804 domain-containing protein [Treponema sp.]
MPQNEICSPQSILDEKGQPHNFGWSKHPDFIYDTSLLYVPRHRITESDRYIVHTPTHMVIFEIRDDGWLGHMGISVISLRDKKRSTQIYSTVIPMGSYQMPPSSVSGSSRWRRKNGFLNFICMEEGVKIIKADIQKFGRHRSLRGALILTPQAGPQSLVTNQPWRGGKKAFRYSQCSPWFFTEGLIQVGSTEIIFTRGNAWGIFDWNRCVRPKADIRYWAAACGHSGGRLLSFCIGYSGADSSQGTENGFFIDGTLHKLEQVTFHIPMSNWLSPWRFTSNDNRLEMTFYPHQERIDRGGLFFHNSARRQVCGFFSGKVQLDDNSIIEFQHLTGLTERSKTQF